MQDYFLHITKPYHALTEQWNGGKPSHNGFVRRFEKLPLNVRRPIVAVALAIIIVAAPILALTGTIHHLYRNYTKRVEIIPLQAKITIDNEGKPVAIPDIQPGSERPIREGGCDRYFEPEVFNTYRKRFKDLLPALSFTQKELNDPLVKEWHCLINRFEQQCSTREHARAWHETFTSELRQLSKALKDSHKNVHAKMLTAMEDWMFNRYFKLDMSDVLEKEVVHFTGGTDEPMSEAMSIHAKIDKSGKLKHGEDVSEPFDAHFYGNQPFKIPSIRLADGHKVKMVRMPSVTRDVKRTKNDKGKYDVEEVEVVEEFLLHLSRLKRDNQIHLYVNLMSRTDGNERYRSLAFENLSNKMDSNLVVVTLDKDSPFYMQRKAADQQASDFKKEFLENMLKEDDRYFFSKSIDKSWLQDTLKSLIEQVHTNNYNAKEVLSVKDKQDFIEILYCRFIEELMIKFHPKTANLSCKHCIDRGAGQIVAFFSYMRQKGLSKVSDLFLKTISFIPSIWVSNRLTPETRYKRTANTVGHFVKV